MPGPVAALCSTWQGPGPGCAQHALLAPPRTPPTATRCPLPSPLCAAPPPHRHASGGIFETILRPIDAAAGGANQTLDLWSVFDVAGDSHLTFTVHGFKNPEEQAAALGACDIRDSPLTLLREENVGMGSRTYFWVADE